MRFIGDSHGKFGELKALIGTEPCVQVGDMCIGYPKTSYPKVLPPNFRFIRGNKDNPVACNKHPNYLGDYGYIDSADLFFVSGAWSINHRYLVPGETWWADEELPYSDLAAALDLYVKEKPRIVVSHECPDMIFNEIFNRDLLPTRTAAALGLMWTNWQPEFWFFGHFHSNKQVKVGNTTFICLDELSYCDVPNIDWNLSFDAIYVPEPEVKIKEITAEDMEYYNYYPSPDQLSLGF